MSSAHKLSLTAAIIINLNIIIGSGIFINTTELAKRAGALGGLSYIIVGMLLLPLILSFVRLLQIHPGGGFYAFSKHSIHPFAGFLSTWIYFTTKLASATVLIHTFILLIKEIFPALAAFNIFFLDTTLLCILLALNLFNVRTGSKIQSGLFAVKLFPLFFVIIAGLFFIQGAHFAVSDQLWAGIPAAIPLVLFAMTGFEAACSVSSKIENPQVNAPRALLVSYGIVILLFSVYQGVFYGILGKNLAAAVDFRASFPLLIETIFPLSTEFINVLHSAIHIAIAASSLSSAFGIIFTNTWNIYTLATENHTYAPRLLASVNRHNTPFVCILVQGIIIVLYLFVTHAHQTTLQQIAALGATTTYSISILGLLATMIQRKQRILLPIFGLINSAIFFAASFYSLWYSRNGIPLHIIGFIIFFGLIMFLFTTNKKQQKINAI